MHHNTPKGSRCTTPLQMVSDGTDNRRDGQDHTERDETDGRQDETDGTGQNGHQTGQTTDIIKGHTYIMR